jgi:REP element-mobilizing transposase RayT
MHQQLMVLQHNHTHLLVMPQEKTHGHTQMTEFHQHSITKKLDFQKKKKKKTLISTVLSVGTLTQITPPFEISY